MIIKNNNRNYSVEINGKTVFCGSKKAAKAILKRGV